MKTFTFEPISREQIRDYCQASGDWNKIHWDEAFAKESGLPSVIAHGMLTMGLAARALQELGYNVDALKSLDSKFKEKALPEDILTAEVTEPQPGQLEIRVVNQDGLEILIGSAQV
jgi:acyl dehydratase